MTRWLATLMKWGHTLDPHALDQFLAEAGPRALIIARVAMRDRDEAMDVVQDAMTKLVTNYADREPAAWAPLFHTILQSRIRDWMRREKVRARVRGWLGGVREDEADQPDPIQEAPDPHGLTPDQELVRREQAEALKGALAELPYRQQQVFMLRAWEGLSTADAARAVGCSEGSVKTHYFRAVRALRERLGDQWP